ncbi:MAG: MATE family efflux transporter [Clostridiaceae bacterium]|nr:MATE family efflux transporter [Clostridiaceae bacterium]
MNRFFVRDKSFYRTFFRLTCVIALQNVLVCLVNLVDNVMIGAYSENAMSGIALVNQIQFMLQMLINGAGEGMIVMASRYWGERNPDAIHKTISVGMWMGLAFSVLLWALVFFFPMPVLRLLTPEEPVLAEAMVYLRIVCFSYVFFAITQLLLASMRSVETVNVGFAVSVVALFVNIFLNYALIFGKFGFPALGTAGAAWATLIARMAETLVTVIYVRFIDKKLRLRLRTFLRIDTAVLKQYLHCGVPVILSSGVWGIGMAAQTAILGHMGASSIAANSIATTAFNILTVVTYGSANASQVITAKTIGENRLADARQYAKTFQILFLGIGLVTGALIFALRGVIVGMYNISGESAALARNFLAVLSVTVIGTSYQMSCLCGIVRGGGDTRFVLYNDMIFMWGIVLPLSALAAFVLHWPPVAVFACLKSDQVTKCAVAVVKVNRFRWIKSLARAEAK